MRKVEDALTDAINSAKIAQMSESELIETLKALYEIERSTL